MRAILALVVVLLLSVPALAVRPDEMLADPGLEARARAISEGLRQEHNDIRVTVISPGVTRSELAGTITDPGAQAAMAAFRQIAIEPEAIARAIAFSIAQPGDVDVSEIIVRPTASPY